jgi:hypothetical protein
MNDGLFNNCTGSYNMSDVKDYTDNENNHYNGVSSEFGRRVASQNKMQPKYCMPGEATGEMKGEKRNEQKGP